MVKQKRKWVQLIELRGSSEGLVLVYVDVDVFFACSLFVRKEVNL
jgi:hypothetical protein